MTYKPLPSQLTIKTSPIHGLGLYATEDLIAGYELGVTHVKDEEFADGYSRTPLGGFFNHSETPNCEAYADGRFIKLVTINPILKGDELTAYYWLYETDDFE
tara:strand:- start:502 stop:807 length:306 start_codon:yes stop_codon:yes gene_type:complete